jgi:hypothetical protein
VIPRLIAIALLIAPTVIVSACADSEPLRPGFDAATGQFRLASPWRPQLLQIVRLTPLNPAPGDTLRFEAFLINRGNRGIYVETRTCGLNTRGTLSLRDVFFRCAAYSAEGTLAPGDTMRGFEQLLVVSAAGTYSLDVQHLVDPALWVPLTITVRDR